MTPKNRIPELDYLRGFCILAMIAVHFIYDLSELYSLLPPPGALFNFVKNGGGTVFFLLSGICAFLGSHPLKRGLTVLGCALAVGTVTAAAGTPVRFGVLHALGSCMLLWTLFRNIPQKILPWTALLATAVGMLFKGISVSSPFLYPVGLTAPGFVSADYFPLFPYFGYFLAGACLGAVLYPTGRSLLPDSCFRGAVSRVFLFCGRHSLPLYLLHQPVLIGIIEASLFFRRILL